MKTKFTTLEWEDRLSIGYALFEAGFKPTYSTSITDDLIAGYGELDYDFEYPVWLDKDGNVEPLK